MSGSAVALAAGGNDAATNLPSSVSPFEHQQQWLIRFQNRTFVWNTGTSVSLEAKIVDSENEIEHSTEIRSTRSLSPRHRLACRQFVSSCTRWPLDRLRVVGIDYPFVTVNVQSALRGGKGGFGTLLKGQSKQAGAKSTTDFGACRDLQGRRLRHVNDQVGFQVYQQWKERQAAGEATEADLAQALVKTETGVAGWHLPLLPTWAAISKQQKRQYQRQLQNYRREQAALKEQKQAARQAKEQQIQSYVTAATVASDRATDALQEALQQGLQKKEQEEEKPAKRAKVDPTPTTPVAFLTLSGTMTVLLDDGAEERPNNSGFRLQSQDNFSTLGILLQEGATPKLLYYEVRLETAGLAQIGWATRQFAADSDDGDGVGDDAHSWGYDGSRQILLHGDDSSDKDSSAQAMLRQWKKGDVVGCLYDRTASSVHFSLNGDDVGQSLSVKLDGCEKDTPTLFPALSCNHGEIVELRLNKESFEYMPSREAPDVVPVAEVLATAEEEVSVLEQEVDDKKKESATAEDSAPTEPQATSTHGGADTKPSAETVSTKEKEELVVEPLDLEQYDSPQQLEALGLDRLKGALMAIGVKCGGTLEQRAERLFSLKGLKPVDFPQKLLAKKRKTP